MSQHRRPAARAAIRFSLLLVALLAGIGECAALWRARRQTRGWANLSADV